jgi:uncharacterized membrane protein
MPHWAFSQLPLTSPWVVAGVVLIGILAALVEVNALSYAYEKVGIERRCVVAILILSLLGSYVDIPLVQLKPGTLPPHGDILLAAASGTTLAVNVGGAVVPTLVSLYLLVANRLYISAAVSVVIMSVIVHWMATPVHGMGIAVPRLAPPVLAAGFALLLSRRTAPALAHIAGNVGMLIGADLLNIDHLRTLGVSVASIGGAGTFDGVFLTGVLAVLLA